MVVACPKCQHRFEVAESELEGLDPDRVVLLTCPKCGERRKIKAFEKEGTRQGKATVRAVEEGRRAVARGAKEARRKEEHREEARRKEARREEERAKRAGKKGWVDRLEGRIALSEEEERLAKGDIPRMSGRALRSGYVQVLSSGHACLIIAVLGASWACCLGWS